MPDFKYMVTPHLRSSLKEPIGHLFSEEQLISYLENETDVVSIGDEVTATLLSHHFSPIFCVVDYISRRKKIKPHIKDIIQKYGDHVVKVINPAGGITEALWETIRNAYELAQTTTQRIEIEGEEDLAALPAILFAPLNVTIIYGLPDKGVVVVPSTEPYKRKVKEILAEM